MERVELFASRAFQAARQLQRASPGSPLSRVHGHGFRVAAWAAPAGDERDPAGLAAALDAAVARHDYTWLNAALAEPGDAVLAGYLAGSLAWPKSLSLNLASTDETGAVQPSEGGAHIWRGYRIEAAHRLPHVPDGHPCGRMHGHSFRITLEAEVGEALHHPADLDPYWAEVGAPLDYACLNEVAGLENPTAEHLATWLWTRLEEHCEGLRAVSVFETERSGCRFDGSRHTIWKEIPFEAAVYRPDRREGDPALALHGHGYRIRLHVSAPVDRVLGWTVDYGDVKAAFDPARELLDHHTLNDRSGLADGSPVSLARWILAQTGAALPALERVEVYEGPTEGVAVTRAGAPQS